MSINTDGLWIKSESNKSLKIFRRSLARILAGRYYDRPDDHIYGANMINTIDNELAYRRQRGIVI